MLQFMEISGSGKSQKITGDNPIRKQGLPVKVNVEQSIIVLHYLDRYLQQWTYVDNIIALLLLLVV